MTKEELKNFKVPTDREMTSEEMIELRNAVENLDPDKLGTDEETAEGVE